MKNDEILSNVWKLYQNAAAYVGTLGLSSQIKKNIDFFEGRQWSAPTESTKGLPRPVINLVKFICRNKRAMLVSTPIRLVYKCNENPERALQFTEFAAFMDKEMDAAELDSLAVRDAVLKGSYFYHFYWDSTKIGKKGIVEGGLRCEIIDPLNIFFSNPMERDEQKQEWIIISSYIPTRVAKEMADVGVKKDLITDDYDAKSGTSGYCTVLTRYFRQDGEVWCEKAVKKTVIKKPFKISPSDVGTRKAYLYPVVAGSYEEREKCIYGISEAEGLISDQKIVNNILGMQALAIQNTAWGKFVVTKDALRGQQISNEPGEILVDHSISGNGIRRMEEHSLSSMPITYVNNLTAMLRTVSGATEVLTGETLISNMSGTAIAQLQNQANQPIIDQRKRFWHAKQRYGRVLEQFFRLFYDKKQFQSSMGTTEFVASNYDDLDFEITVEAVGGSNGSTAGDINLLETLYHKGDISAHNLITAYPDEMVLDKQRILNALK